VGAAFRWAALAVAASAVLWLAIRTEAPFEPAMESYHLALRGRLPLEVQTGNAPELEAFYAARRSAGVPSHVVDLSPAGFRLLGGGLRQVGQQTVRLTLYSDGRSFIVCDFRHPDAYDGPMPEAGKPVTFTSGGLSFVVQRMGDEICILASRMPLFRMVALLTGA